MCARNKFEETHVFGAHAFSHAHQPCQCKCLDPNYKPPVTKPAACGAPDYKGDGQCDDNNNKASCDYDDGDCCGPDIGNSYCNEVL